MRRGGKALQGLASSNESRGVQDASVRRGESSPPTHPQPPVQQSRQLEGGDSSEVAHTEVSRPTRGRGGRILSQLASLSLRDNKPVGDSRPPSVDHSSDTDSPAQSNAGVLSRQGSDLSRSSVVSQQFAQVEQVNYKASLPKDPTITGSQIKVSLNYMTFETNGGSSIEEYSVEFQPNIESIRLRYTILRSDQAKAICGSVMHWTGTNLYLPIKLSQRQTIFATNHPVTNAEVKVRLTWVKTPPDDELLPFYNSLMHKVMTKLRFVVINRQHYSPLHKINIEQHKLEVWPGWITAIQRLDGGLKLVVDASFKVLRLETVYDILVHIKNRQGGRNMKEAFEEALVGKIIMTRYNNRAYRIDGIDITKKPTDTFTMTRNGDRQISYIDYMKEQWNLDIQIPNQPLLIHRPKPKRGETEPPVMYLIPELCVTTGLTDEMRANNLIMRDIITRTRLAPDIRETKLLEFLNSISTDERAKTVFAEWNLSVKNTLDVVNARRLDNESLLLANNRQISVPDNVDWTRPVTSSPVFKSVDIERWVFMFCERDAGIADEFARHVKEVSHQLGIKFFAPRIVKLPNDSAQTYVNFGKREVKPTDQLVVMLTPGKGQREDRYSACKRLYSCELSIPCQFIRCGTIDNERRIRSVVQKVVIQILSKVGGQPWAMKFPMKSFMIVGMDVYHDTIDRKKSCVGFVASMNEFTSSWWSRTFFQNSLEEIGQKLNNCMTSAIRKYHSLNGFVPQKIIIYRDGVGDGQLDTLIEFEVAQVINAIKFYMRDSHAGDPLPHISYVVVQKRINAKLTLRDRGSLKNPLPGSFLDHTITHPEYNDFYLVSQHVNQGTVSPTKYVVLTETGNLKMPHHQKLAYKMTHMYYNWCGTIRVPAPCQYAHKLAYLTGQNIRQQASERLEDRLYYL